MKNIYCEKYLIIILYININYMKFTDDLNKTIDEEIKNICINNKCKKNILVLGGGGMKGLGILGSIKYLEEIDVIKNIEIFAGTSIGLIISILLIIGYNSTDIYKFTKLFDMRNSFSFNINSLFTDYSINKYDNYEIIINEMLKNKNISSNTTLLELYKLTKKKVIGTTACLTTRDVEYISYEKYPDLNILTLIKMTSAIPLLFSPVKYNGNLYVDGGIIDNFPICLFENQLENVIGINLVSEYNTKEIKNIVDYFLLIMGIFINCGIKNYTGHKYKNIVYNLNMPETNPFNFTMSQKNKKKLFLNGYEFMKNNYKK